MLPHPDELREFKLFQELNDRELEVIAKVARKEELGQGAYLTRTGAPANTLYLIRSGTVTVLATGPDGRDIAVDELGPGQIIGWSTLTGPYIFTASTVTKEKCNLIVINGNRLREIFEINNHIGYRVLKGVGYVVGRHVSALQAKLAHLNVADTQG